MAFAFMYSMGLWKTHFAIGIKASGLSLTKPNWFSQHDQPTILHTLFHRTVGRFPVQKPLRKTKCNFCRYLLPFCTMQAPATILSIPAPHRIAMRASAASARMSGFAVGCPAKGRVQEDIF